VPFEKMPRRTSSAQKREGATSLEPGMFTRVVDQGQSAGTEAHSGDAQAAEALFRLSASPAIGAPSSVQGANGKPLFPGLALRSSPYFEFYPRNGTATPMFTGILGGSINSAALTPQALNDQSVSGLDALGGTSPRWQTFSGALQQQYFAPNSRDGDARRPTGAPLSGSFHLLQSTRLGSLSPCIRDLTESGPFHGTRNFNAENTPLPGARYAHSSTAAMLDALVGESASTPAGLDDESNSRFRLHGESRASGEITGANTAVSHDGKRNAASLPMFKSSPDEADQNYAVQLDILQPTSERLASTLPQKRKRTHLDSHSRKANPQDKDDEQDANPESSSCIDSYLELMHGKHAFPPDSLQELFNELVERYRRAQPLWLQPWDQIRPVVEDRYNPDGSQMKIVYIPVLVPLVQNPSTLESALVSEEEGAKMVQACVRESGLSGSQTVGHCYSSRVGASIGSWRSESALAAENSERTSECEDIAYVPSPTIYAHHHIPAVRPDMPEGTRKEIEKLFSVREFKQKTRQAAIIRYRQKKRERRFIKIVRYSCRKILADSRPRIRGRFVKQDPLG